MTPMLLVTGFLGSGKTTLLKEIAAHRGDRKLAFLVNEFSPTDIDGEEVRSSYSICISPQDNDLRVAIKKVPGGTFSTYANETLSEGVEIEVLQPAENGRAHV